ncbi:MAG TPA: hypothetical protein IAC24_04745 [Candidatus Onthousia faecigallinarum]|nr:hypothetical protein [Candidatus Onthousia faecigallinarum]
MRKQFFVLIMMIMIGMGICINVRAEDKTGFFVENGSSYYYKNGVIQMGITEIEGENYFLGEYTGKVQVGFVTSSLTGDHYYTDSTGKIQTGFVTIGEDTYYFDPDGKLQYGITEVNGEDYFLGEYTGKVQVGFVTSSLTGDHYYTDSTGKIQTGFVTIGEDTYYFDSDGKLQYGITEIGGEDYFLGEYTGKVQVGFVASSLTGDRYYTDENGKILKGITELEDGSYFFGEYTGKIQTGYVQSSLTGKYYITDENGKIYKDSFDYNGTTYYTLEDGSLIDGFYDKEGARYYYILGVLQYGITEIEGEDYFLGEYTGKVQVGFVTSFLTGDRYYTDENGKILKGITKIGDQKYFLGELTGKIQTGWVTALDGKIYYTNQEGVIQTGIQTIEGRVYKFDENGVIETGFQTINGNTYYYDVDGTMVTGVQKIQGSWYRFNPDGVLREQGFKRIADISYHQGKIDWDTLWSSGEIDGVILRIGYNGVEDSLFKEYLSNVKRLNIPYGVYLYSYAHNPAEAIFEANATVQMLSKYDVNPDYPVYYDIESYSIPSQNESSDDISQEDYEGMVYNFSNRLQAAGYETKVYTYLNYAMNRFNENTRSMVDWIAHYTSWDCGYELPHRGWQYTSTGRLPGISTNVDLNIFYY